MSGRSKTLTMIEESALIDALTNPKVTAAQLIVLTKEAQECGLFQTSQPYASLTQGPAVGPTRKLNRNAAKPALMPISQFQALMDQPRVATYPTASCGFQYSPHRGHYTPWNSGYGS
jgi:hypothetical protein